MRIFVEFRGGTTLSIPFREASKVFHHCDYFTSNRFKTRVRTGNGMVTSTCHDLVHVKPLFSVSKLATTRLSVI